MAKPIRLVTVSVDGEELEPLMTAATEAGVRLGWLEIGATPALELEARAPRGVMRAVALDRQRSVAVKRIGGEPVLRDVLREHFLGCVAVLIRRVGEVPPRLAPQLETAARLERVGERWRLERAGRSLSLDAGEVVATLGRPSWWRDDD